MQNDAHEEDCGFLGAVGYVGCVAQCPRMEEK